MESINLADEAFDTSQVCQLVTVTNRQVVYWDEKGLVKPSVRPAAGRGSRRLYSYLDLLALKVVKGLRDLGISLQKVRKCVSYLRGHLPDVSHPLTCCRLITDGDTVLLVEDEKTGIDTVRKRGQMVMLDIAVYDRELRSGVMQFSRKRVVTVYVGEYAHQVEVEPDLEDGGYVGMVAGLPGCITDGDTIDEVLENAQDAIECWLEAREDLKRRGIDVPTKKRRRKRATA